MVGISTVMAEKPKVTENVNITMETSTNTKKSKGRVIILAASIVGTLALAGIVVAAIYVGHFMTQKAYQEARMYYQDDDGTIVEEKVLIYQKEVDFEAKDRFSVVYDFENKVATIRTGDKCYMTTLTPDMGSLEEIQQRINSASAAGGFATNMDQTVEFAASNRTVEIPSGNSKAVKMCAGRPVTWMNRISTGHQTGLVKRAVAADGCGGGESKEVVIIIIIIIIVEAPSAC